MKKRTRKKSEKMEKRGKKTNKDDKTLWHPNTHSPVLSSRLNTHSHEVEVLGTLHSQTLCVAMDDNEQEPSENTNQSHTHTVLLGFALCVRVSERQMDAQTIRSVKGVRRVIDKTTSQDLSSHDGKAVHIHSTSVVFGASGHLWCHEERCANTTRHCHACLHRLHCSCFSKVCHPVCCVCCDAFHSLSTFLSSCC